MIKKIILIFAVILFLFNIRCNSSQNVVAKNNQRFVQEQIDIIDSYTTIYILTDNQTRVKYIIYRNNDVGLSITPLIIDRTGKPDCQ